MRGLHLTADLYQCRCEAAWLADADRLGAWCKQALEAADLAVDHAVCATAAAGGTVALVMAGSHVCLHTWAADRSASVDVYLAPDAGGAAGKARDVMQALIGQLQPQWTEQRSLDRGDGQ